MKKTAVISYVLLALCAWYCTAGMFYAEQQGRFSYCLSEPYYERSARGVAIVAGALYAAIWPVVIPAAYALSGGAYYGLWAHRRDLWRKPNGECHPLESKQ